MKAKIARFDANQTPNIANMAFMNAHFAGPHLRDSFSREKIPGLCVIMTLSHNLPKVCRFRAGTRPNAHKAVERNSLVPEMLKPLIDVPALCGSYPI